MRKITTGNFAHLFYSAATGRSETDSSFAYKALMRIEIGNRIILVVSETNKLKCVV
jgi:hypothetical protein